MPERSYIAIGDIHGCLRSVQALIKKLTARDDRTLIFIGDYIDRGPSSRQVVDYLLALQEHTPCIFIRGNHEQMLLDACETNETALWLYNGGDTTLRSYKSLAGIENEHLDFYRNTRLFYDTQDYLFVHAGLKPRRTIRECIEKDEFKQDFLWERSHLKTNRNKWEKTVVFGHTPVPEPVVGRNMIGIDTGCVYARRSGMGKLTAVLLPEQEFIYQQCLDEV
ncbi:MAG: metallophosphoesterase family protein [Balneolales bacterium]